MYEVKGFPWGSECGSVLTGTGSNAAILPGDADAGLTASGNRVEPLLREKHFF